MPIHQRRFNSQDFDAMDRVLASRPFAAGPDDSQPSAQGFGHRLGQYALGDAAPSGYADAEGRVSDPVSVGHAADETQRRITMGSRQNASGRSLPERRRFADASPALDGGAETGAAYADAEIQRAHASVALPSGYADYSPPASAPSGYADYSPAPGGAVSDGNVSVPSAPSPGLTSISPGAQYKDEDKKYGWRTDLSPANRALLNPESPTYNPAEHQRLSDRTDVRVTKYLTEEQRQEHALNVNKHGLLKDAAGRKKDTRNGNGGGFNPTNGTEIFAMGMDGSLNVADAARESKLGAPDELMHHTSFYAGGDVAGAGELKIDQGRLREVSDQSGHYKPPAEITHQSVAHMAKSREDGGLGISMMDDRLDDAGNAINKPVNVRLGAKPGLGDDSVTLTHQQFLQTGGNEKQIRAKRSLNDEIAAHGPREQQAQPDAPTQYANAPATQYANIPAGLIGCDGVPPSIANAVIGGYDSVPPGPSGLGGYDGIPSPLSGNDLIPSHANGYGVPIPASNGYGVERIID